MGNGLCAGLRNREAQRPTSGGPPPSSAAAGARPGSGGRVSVTATATATTAARAGGGPAAAAGGGAAAAAAAAPSGHAGETRTPLMASTPADRKAAEELKAEGNALYKKAKYAAAIEKYTEAITLAPEWSVPYINRGMAARKRGEWERVEADASSALALGGERESMKGHYLLGLAMGAKGQHHKSTQHLRKALEAAREANDSIKDEIWRELATANYQHWQTESAARKATHAALRRQLAAMLAANGAEANGSGAAAAAGGGASGGAADLPPEWAALFKSAANMDVPSEAPSQFTCPLTMEIFRDPVVTPSGRSYERAALLEHMRKVGRFDPITRQPLTPESLVPNVSLRAAIEVYLEEHPWAWGEVK